MQTVSEKEVKADSDPRQAIVKETMMHQQEGGDEEPDLPDERLECQATQEELQTQGQGLQSKRHGPATNRPASNSRRAAASSGQRRARRSQIQVAAETITSSQHQQQNNMTQQTDAIHQSAVDSRNTQTVATKGTNGTNNGKEQPNVAPTGRESTNKDTSQQGKTDRQQEEPDPHPAGTKLGHYVFGKSLGKGTFGKVKMAEHILTKESVAIKILEKARIKDRKDIDRISREIKILKKVRHPNVIQLYEIIETETELYLIMEYCVNGELFDYIVQHQRLHEKAAIRIFQQLVSGIEYIHKSGICHRDLKPENLLLDFDKTLKIVDFGLSNIYEAPDGLLKTACGSPCYAAPEMIAGKKYLGLKSDIWSSGVVLYAMVCGFLPFEDPKTSNLYKKIMAGEFKIPRFLSTDCSHFISKVLQTDPCERYGIEQIREHPWYRQFRDKQPTGLFPGKEVMPLEDTIYEQILDEFGFDPDYAVKCIEANRHNNITSTYHLLYKKALRQKKPFTNVSHVGGSLDRAAVAQYERMETEKAANNERHPRYQVNSDWQNQQPRPDPAVTQHKRGTSTNYNNYKNSNVLQSVNGGAETANLKPDQAVALSAQKRYKMELQAEISKLRERYSQVTKKPTTKPQPVAEATIMDVGIQKAEPMTSMTMAVRQTQKRTERQQYSRHRGTITDNSAKASPDTNPRRPQNRVNMVQIQNQHKNDVQGNEEVKQNSQVLQTLPSKNQKQVKQYSSQPGNSTKQDKFDDQAQMDEYVFNGSEIEDVLQDQKADRDAAFQDSQVIKPVQQAFQSLEDDSAQKVSNFSSLNGATNNKSSKINDDTQTKTIIPSSATTTKGSNVLRSHIKKKRSDALQQQMAMKEEFLNSSMPINLPTQQVDEPFVVKNVAKSGGRKLNNNPVAASVMMAHGQMRYRQQKTSSSNNQAANSDQGERQLFNTLGDQQPSDLAVQMNHIRSKKNQQYVSMNATQNLMNNSLDLTQHAVASNTTYSTIAAGQSSKNVAQVSMNQRQIDHLTNNLNKTQNVRQSSKPNTNGAKYNINRASLGGIIGHQKHLQAQRANQINLLPQAQAVTANAKVSSGSGIMPSIHETNLDNLQAMNQHSIRQANHQHPTMKHHRQSFKQTANQAQLINQEASPHNQASILARRAGSQQWRNNSNLSNKGGRDSVNSNHSHQQHQVAALFQSNSAKRQSNNASQPPHTSQMQVAQQQATGSTGDYDFTTIETTINASGMAAYAKQHAHHPARIITSSESGQVGISKPLQLTHINPNGFGQTSENQMNLVAANTIDFHHVGSNPQSNSRIYQINQSGSANSKVQQMKNRKGINQSIDMKPAQVAQIKQGLRASSQLGPSSQISRKSAQSRQFAFESDLSNNYASQISGWVNQSILPGHQQQSELLDQSAASLKARMRQGKQTAQDSQASNYNMQQIYSQYAPPKATVVGAKIVKGGRLGMTGSVQQRVVHSVLENHVNNIFDTSGLGILNESNNILAQPTHDSINLMHIDNKIITNTKVKSQVTKQRIEIPQSHIQKQQTTNVRTTPVQQSKKLTTTQNNNFQGQNLRASFVGNKQQYLQKQ